MNRKVRTKQKMRLNVRLLISADFVEISVGELPGVEGTKKP